MIDFVFTRDLIETYLETNFNTVPIQFENKRIEDAIEYIAVEDSNNDTESLGSGINAYRIDGFLTIKIYTELGIGTNRSKTIASELVTLLNQKELETFMFQVPILNSFGQVKNADHYQQNLTIPYTYVYGQSENIC